MRHLFFISLIATIVGIGIASRNRDAYLLYRTLPASRSALEALLHLHQNDHIYKVDFWKEPRGVKEAADVMIHSKLKEEIEKYFTDNNVLYNVTVPDVEKLILRNEWKDSHSNTLGSYSKRLNDDPILDSEPDDDWSKVGRLRKAKYPFGDYASYADMMKYMRTIEFYYASFTKIIRIGTTHDGRPMEGLKIGYPISSTSKKAIWIDGNIHAREWASSHTALFIINQLVSGYKKDDTITHYINNLNFYIVPCLNADGYEYTRSSPSPAIRLWRKNRSPEVCTPSLWGGERCCQGVDLNRNFDFHWDGWLCAVKRFLSSDEMWGKVDAFITLHTYAQLWIYPYSHMENSYPEDISELRSTARRAISRLESMYGTIYRMGTGADTLSPASGGSDDWAKSKMNVKYVYLIELRPEEHLSHGFILHKKELIPTGVETFEGIKEVIDDVLRVNRIVKDPLSPQLRKKQEFRMRMLTSAAVPPPFTTPRTTPWTTSSASTTRPTAATTTTKRSTTTRATTSTPTTTMSTSTTSTTTTSTTSTSTTTVTSSRRHKSHRKHHKHTIAPTETSTAFSRPTVPQAPPTFVAGNVRQGVRKLTEEERKREEVERRREVEETRRRVKEIEERKRKENETRERLHVEEERLEREQLLKEERREREEREKHKKEVEEERRRVAERRAQEEQWRRENARQLEEIRRKHDEEERVQELKRAELERARLQTAEIVRHARKLDSEPQDEKADVIFEAHDDPRTRTAVPVRVVEMRVSTVVPSQTAQSPKRVYTVSQTIARVVSRNGPIQSSSPDVVTSDSERIQTAPTVPPPSVTQRYAVTRRGRPEPGETPAAFLDPQCRDMRYSCGFWVSNTPDACVTQRSFMRSQCAYTCRFCEPVQGRKDQAYLDQR